MYAYQSLNRFKSLTLLFTAIFIVLFILPFPFWNTAPVLFYMNILTPITSLFATVLVIYTAWWSYKNYKEVYVPWLLLAMGMFIYSIASMLYFIFVNVLRISPSLILPDTFFLVTYPLLGIILLLFLKKYFKIRTKVLLDAVIVTVSAIFIVWFLIIWPIIQASPENILSMALSMSYLFLDCILLFSILALLFNQKHRISELSILLISWAILLRILGTIVYAFNVMNPDLFLGWLTTVLYTSTSASIALATIAFLENVHIDLKRLMLHYGRFKAKNEWVSFLPLALVLFVYGLLIISKTPDRALIWSVGIIIILIIIRQAVSLNEIKKGEKLVKKSLMEKETLLREIHHRVNNNFQIISSLLSLQSQNVVNEEDHELFVESQNRVKSMAMIHENLYLSDNLSAINFSNYIKTRLNSLIYDYSEDLSQIDLELDVEKIELNIETSVPCGLIITELVSNSLKHAFPNGRNGKIIIKMYAKNEEYVLIIGDDGVGHVEASDLKKGETLGLSLVNSLVKQIDGNIVILKNKGTFYKITFRELKYKERL